MADPNVQQSMNEALNNPDFVNMLIESNPMLRNIPNAREIITSPFMREMMSNPAMIGQAMRMQRNMGGDGSAFPAPGATDTTPQSAATGGSDQGGNNIQLPWLNPFLGQGTNRPEDQGLPDLQRMMQQFQMAAGNPAAWANPYGTGSAQTGTGSTPSQGTTASQGTSQAQGTTPSQGGTSEGTSSPPPANPFAALFGPPGGSQANPFGMNPASFQEMLQMMGGGSPSPAAPADNRPPEERYAEQLRQLNDMGFVDFDRNIAALRRSGGSVQGAIEHLLSS